MRKFTFCLLALLLCVGVAFAATPGYRQDPGTGDILGQGKYQSDAHKIFRMVRYVPTTYAGADTLDAPALVIWSLTADDGVTVTTTTTSADSAVAGIIVTQALTPDVDGNTAVEDRGGVNWTWLQTYGYSTVDITVQAVAAGEAFGASTTAGEANSFTIIAAMNARAMGIAGFLYDKADAEAEDVECFLTLD